MFGVSMAEEPTSGGKPSADKHVQQVLESAQKQLHSLHKQRNEVTRRIVTVKRMLISLAEMFGEKDFCDELLQEVGLKRSDQKRGLTSTCRQVLMESAGPISTRKVQEEIARRNPSLLTGHKDPQASLITILNRLVRYGEIEPLVGENGRREWKWLNERASPEENPPKP
jgi:hypothetical protein